MKFSIYSLFDSKNVIINVWIEFYSSQILQLLLSAATVADQFSNSVLQGLWEFVGVIVNVSSVVLGEKFVLWNHCFLMISRCIL